MQIKEILEDEFGKKYTDKAGIGVSIPVGGEVMKPGAPVGLLGKRPGQNTSDFTKPNKGFERTAVRQPKSRISRKLRKAKELAAKYTKQTRNYMNVKKWPAREKAIWQRTWRNYTRSNNHQLADRYLLKQIIAWPIGFSSSPIRMIFFAAVAYATYLYNVTEEYRQGKITGDEYIKKLATGAALEGLVLFGGQKALTLLDSLRQGSYAAIEFIQLHKRVAKLIASFSFASGAAASVAAGTRPDERKKCFIDLYKQEGRPADEAEVDWSTYKDSPWDWCRVHTVIKD